MENTMEILFCIIVIIFVFWYKNKKSRKSQKIPFNPDRFNSLEQVSEELKANGLESSSLIFAVDFTKSNEWQGKHSFNGQCLHLLSPNKVNPYQQVIRILGKTLESMDDDHWIPAFGFGDTTTTDKSVFPLCLGEHCYGFHNVLEAYNNTASKVQLSGPTNFAPVIYRAVEIVRATGKYHILVIIADGQVTNERQTKQAIIDASNWPLSIVVIGVGDGPWGTMEYYDNSIENRKFDNFQFVDYTKVTATAKHPDQSFALHALMEIPDQYRIIRQLNLLDL